MKAGIDAHDKRLENKHSDDASVITGKTTLKPFIGVLGALLASFAVYQLLASITVEPGALPDPHVLSREGIALAAIFAAALVLWATEAIPIAATSLLILVLPPLLGAVPSIKAAAVGFTSPVVFFVISAYCFAFALVKSGIGWRFALWLFTLTGSVSKRALLGIMAGTATISALISDVPACAIFMALTLPMLTKIEAIPGESNIGKAMMIGIPIAALIGGVATPAGSSINILGLDLLKSTAGIDISFLQWMAIGVPVSVLLVPTAWWIIVKSFPPEVDIIGDPDQIQEELRSMGPFKTEEKKILLILSILFTLWVLSTWIKPLDVATVSICGAVVMFLPGINLLSWDAVQKNIGWETVLMIGSVTSLGIISSESELSAWLVKNTLGNITGWNMFVLVASISAFTVILHLPLPVNPAINAVLIPAMVVLAQDSGINPALFALPVIFTASCAFLLPLDAVPLVTYSKGYYRMFDMFIPGALISIAWIIAMTAAIFTIAPLVGLK
jgi:solute carrier family 13 (sodium-dependent dicarboxylate transporter), member 2/3/5